VLGATGVTLAALGADVLLAAAEAGVEAACVRGAVDAGHSGSGVLEHAARVSAEASSIQREACEEKA